MPGRGSRNPKIVFIGESPGNYEDRVDKPFLGDSGTMIAQILDESNISADDVRFTNSVRCFSHDGNNVPTPPPLEARVMCSQYLVEELIEVTSDQVPVLVPIGNTATSILLGREVKITQIRGQVLTIKIGGIEYKVVPTIHPSMIIRGGDGARKKYLPLLKSDIRKAHAVSTGMIVERSWAILTEVDEVADLVDSIIAQYESGEIPYTAYDLEVGGRGALRYSNESYIIGVALATSIDKGYFIALQHRELLEADVSPWDYGRVPEYDREKWFLIVDQIRRLLSKVPVTGHHLKYDGSVTRKKLNLELKILFDTMIASYLRYHEQHDHGLKDNLEYYTDIGSYDDELGKYLTTVRTEYLKRMKSQGTPIKLDKSDRDYGWAPLQLLGKYACYDAMGSFQLAQIFEVEIDKYDLRAPLELRLDAINKFSRIELFGNQLDMENLNHFLSTYTIQLEELYTWIRNHPAVKAYEDRLNEGRKPNKSGKLPAWKIFNPGSSPSAAKVIYGYLGVKDLGYRTKSGNLSVDDTSTFNIVKHLREVGDTDKLEFIEHFRLWKKVKKLITSYFGKLPKWTDEYGRIHTNYLFHRVAGGRVSTVQPGLHLLPWHSDARRLITSRWHKEGGLIIQFDYSQLEPRVLAGVSQDVNFVNAYKNSEDLHTMVAKMVYGKEVVSEAERRFSKTQTFLMVYGGGPKSMADAFKGIMTLEQAQENFAKYYERFPGIKKYIDDTHAFTKFHGYVRTKTGFIRWLPDAQLSTTPQMDQIERKSVNKRMQRALRQSQNCVIQGTASDITLTAILLLMDEMDRRGLKSQVCGFVHDAILNDIYPGELLEVTQLVKYCMEELVVKIVPWMGEVPLKAEGSIGRRWDGDCEVISIDDSQVTVEGPVRWFKEIVESLSMSNELDIEVEKEYEKSVSDELVLRKAYEGAKESDYIRAKLVVGARLAS